MSLKILNSFLSWRVRYTQRYSQIKKLKNIFAIFWNYFWNIFGIKVYVKCAVVFKYGGHSNNKLTGLLIIAGGSLLLSQEPIKERREQRK